MSDSHVCRAWRPSECEGTPTCPPRCPRFVDAAGRAVLVRPREPPFEAVASGLEPPTVGRVRPDDLLLAATADGAVRGYAWLRPAADGDRRASLAVAPGDGDGDLRVELARQAVAHAVADGASRLLVEEPDPFETAGVAVVEPADGGHAVSLNDPAAATLTTPPGMDAGSGEGGGGVGSGEGNADDADAAADVGDEGAGRSLAAAGAANSTAPLGVPDEGPALAGLFDPDAVAVVGATDAEGSIGRLLLENLSEYGGEVVPVTPRSETVFGRPAPDSLAEVGHADLAVVAVPPEPAIEAVETAGQQGIEHVVVVSAGFEEAGGTDHARRLRAVGAEHDLTLVGPNSMGVASTATGLNATFSPRHPPQGSVSLVSQSGAFITAVVAAASDRGLGFRNVVSVGNKAVLDEVDLLQSLDADPGTDVVAMYLEDVASGDEFVEVAREVTRTTPVVVLKSGRTEAGAQAAASHTGSLASDDAAVDAALDRAGVLRAESTEQLLDYAAALGGPVPEGDAVGVVTNAGGPGVLATDAASDEGLSLADFDDGTRDRLAGLLPGPASAGNPVDVLGDADADRFAAAIDAVLADGTVDVGVAVTTPHPLVDYGDLVAAVGRRSLARDTPVVTCLMDGDLDADAKRALRRYGVANYPNPGRAAAAIGALQRYARLRDRPPVESPPVDLDRERIRELVADAREAGRDRLGVESLDVLEACGIAVPEWGLAESADEAAAIAREIGQDVVLKVASPDLAHKADVGGVRVGIDPAEASGEYETMLADVRDAAPDATVDGVVVQATADVEGGVETVVGATDSGFGPLVAFGLGGTLVEHVDDVAFELAPLDRRTAGRLVDAIEAAGVLDGPRGQDPVDREALVEALVGLSALVEAVPEIEALDVNPLVATAEGATAVDLQVELVAGE